MKAVIIRTDDSRELVEFTRETEYQMLSDAVGGYIERVPLPNLGVDMWVNEEGKINCLEYNLNATLLWIDSWGDTDWTAGDAVLTGGADEEGYVMGLPDELVDALFPDKSEQDAQQPSVQEV